MKGNVTGTGQLNSKWIHEVIVSPKMENKTYKDFCPTVQTRIIALLFGDFMVSVGILLATSLVFWWARNPCNFRFAFWEKSWPHIFILNLTDLYILEHDSANCTSSSLNWNFFGGLTPSNGSCRLWFKLKNYFWFGLLKLLSASYLNYWFLIPHLPIISSLGHFYLTLIWQKN